MKISIIAPVYKVEALLGRCLDSVLQQTEKDFELILIDDGSPDGSGAICDQCAEKDDRVVVIHQPNGGAGSARNAGLKAATGEFISFIDSDDFIGPDYLKHMKEAQQLRDADLVITRFNRLREGDKNFFEINPARGEVFAERAEFQDVLPWLFSDIRIGSLCNKLFRKRILDGLSYDTSAKICGDVVLVSKVLLQTQSIQTTDASDYNYVVRSSGSITSQNNPQLYIEYLKAQRQIEENIERGGWMTDNMRRALDERMVRYLTRSAHSIQRGPWSAKEREKYIGELLQNDEMRKTALKEFERTKKPEFQLMSQGKASELLRLYENTEQKNKFIRKLPKGLVNTLVWIKNKIR